MEAVNPEGLLADLSEDSEGRFLSAYDQAQATFLGMIRVYVCSDNISIAESDVRVMWSGDRKKCGVSILGQMRGMIDIVTGQEVCDP